MIDDADSMGAMGQMAAAEPSLATVLLRWMHDERLRASDVARNSGLSRHHVGSIAKGAILRPTPETLRQLAVGLACHPDGGEPDPLKRDQALRELSQAAGYADLADDPVHGDLMRAIRGVLGNEQAAEFWREMIERHGLISPMLQHLIRALIETHNRPGGERLMSMLLLLNSDDPFAVSELVRRLGQAADPPPAS